MRAESRRARRALVLGLALAAGPGTAALAGLAAAPVAAEGFYGTLTGQYQHVEQGSLLLQPDGTLRAERHTRAFWLQNYELNYSEMFSERLQLLVQLSYQNLSYTTVTQSERVPYGSLRLIHPRYGVIGSYRPVTTVGTLGATGFGGAVDTTTRRFTTRRREASVFAYLAPEGLPRLDLTWVRRSQWQDLAPLGDIGLDRNARLTWDRGPFSVRGGYGQLRRESGGVDGPLQRAADAAASFRAVSAPGRSLLFDYQFTWNKSGRPESRADLTRTHAATMNGSLRQSAHAQWTAFYSYRRSELRTFQRADLDDHDGSLLFHYAPTPAVDLASGAGARTERLAGSADLFYYGTAMATARGRVRPGWTGTAGLTHVTNWAPGKRRFGVEMLRLGSGFTLARGLLLNADVLATASSDTAGRLGRDVLQPSVGISMTPLPAIGIEYSWRAYRAGPGFVRPPSRSLSDRLDLRWRPFAGLDLTGSVSRTGQLPDDNPRVVVRQGTLRWAPSPRLQLTGNYVKSSQSRTFSGTGELAGQELIYGRLLAGLSRSLTLNAGYSLSDRGRPSESDQLDASLTWTFGR